MKSSIASLRISWLADPGATPVEQGETSPDVVRTAAPIPEEIGYGWMESLDLAFGMAVFWGVRHFNQAASGMQVPYVKHEGILSEPVLIVSSAQTGTVILKERQIGVEFKFSHGNCLFQHVGRFDQETSQESNETVRITTIVIGDSQLRMLVGESSAQAMMQKLGLARVPSTTVFEVPATITAILHSSFNQHLSGHLRKLQAQAKLLEYLCALTEFMTIKIAMPPLACNKVEKVRALHEELSLLTGNEPTLGELSTRYGLSARLLSEEFKRVYGQSISSFMANHRFKAAQEALLNTSLPMKVIAAQFGYAHVNHFINAFSKKFGYPPASLRRGRIMRLS